MRLFDLYIEAADLHDAAYHASERGDVAKAIHLYARACHMVQQGALMEEEHWATYRFNDAAWLALDSQQPAVAESLAIAGLNALSVAGHPPILNTCRERLNAALEAAHLAMRPA